MSLMGLWSAPISGVGSYTTSDDVLALIPGRIRKFATRIEMWGCGRTCYAESLVRIIGRFHTIGGKRIPPNTML